MLVLRKQNQAGGPANDQPGNRDQWFLVPRERIPTMVGRLGLPLFIEVIAAFATRSAGSVNELAGRASLRSHQSPVRSDRRRPSVVMPNRAVKLRLPITQTHLAPTRLARVASSQPPGSGAVR